MTKNLTVIVFKPDSQSTDELMVYVDPLQYRKWKDGDTTIPLVDIVDTFSVYHTGQGTQGLQMKPSNQQLDTIFGTHRAEDVIQRILKEGKPQHGDLESNVYMMEKNKMPSRNISRGSIDKGRRPAGI